MHRHRNHHNELWVLVTNIAELWSDFKYNRRFHILWYDKAPTVGRVDNPKDFFSFAHNSSLYNTVDQVRRRNRWSSGLRCGVRGGGG